MEVDGGGNTNIGTEAVDASTARWLHRAYGEFDDG